MSLKVVLTPLLSVNLFVIINVKEAVKSMNTKILRVSIETAIARTLAISYLSINIDLLYRSFFLFFPSLFYCSVELLWWGVVFIVARRSLRTSRKCRVGLEAFMLLFRSKWSGTGGPDDEVSLTKTLLSGSWLHCQRRLDKLHFLVASSLFF